MLGVNPFSSFPFFFGTSELYAARFLYHFQKVFNADTYIDYFERTLRSYFPRKIYLIQDNASVRVGPSGPRDVA